MTDEYTVVYDTLLATNRTWRFAWGSRRQARRIFSFCHSPPSSLVSSLWHASKKGVSSSGRSGCGSSRRYCLRRLATSWMLVVSNEPPAIREAFAKEREGGREWEEGCSIQCKCCDSHHLWCCWGTVYVEAFLLLHKEKDIFMNTLHYLYCLLTGDWAGLPEDSFLGHTFLE